MFTVEPAITHTASFGGDSKAHAVEPTSVVIGVFEVMFNGVVGSTAGHTTVLPVPKQFAGSVASCFVSLTALS